MQGTGNGITEVKRGMRPFLVIWLGQLISIFGSGLTAFALGVWTFQETGQATPFAITVLSGSIPRILLSPLAGSMADRKNRRWIMILTDTGSAVVTFMAVLLVWTGKLQIWHIYVLAAIGASMAAFQEPAYTSSITMLVPADQLARASGLVQMSQAMEMLVAPLLAGVLYASIGLQGVMLIDFATYFFAIGSLALIPIPQPPPPETEVGQKPGVWSDARFGWLYLRSRPGLFGLLLYFALANYMLNTAGVLLGPLVLSIATPQAMGLVQTLGGVGMLAGSLIMSLWGGPTRRIYAVIGFVALAGVGLMTTGWRADLPLVISGTMLLMAAIPLASGPSQAIFQSKVALNAQGRVFAMRGMIARSMMPLAFLLAGPLADQVFGPLMGASGPIAGSPIGSYLGVGPGRGIGLMLIACGLITILASVMALLHPRIRNLERDIPDVVGEIDSLESERRVAVP